MLRQLSKTRNFWITCQALKLEQWRISKNCGNHWISKGCALFWDTLDTHFMIFGFFYVFNISQSFNPISNSTRSSNRFRFFIEICINYGAQRTLLWLANQHLEFLNVFSQNVSISCSICSFERQYGDEVVEKYIMIYRQILRLFKCNASVQA